MGYNSNCWSQNCNYNCCDFWGYCTSNPNNCYHYYHDTNNAGVIAGAVIGGVLGIALIIILICYCYKRRQQQRLQEQIRRQNLNNPNPNQYDGTTIVLQGYGPHAYGQPYVQPGGNCAPAYGQPANQPAYFGGQGNAGHYGPPLGQPVYHNQPQNDQFAR